MTSIQKVNNKKPLVALIMGDPAGIGPEIALKALSSTVNTEKYNPVIVGNYSSSVELMKKWAPQLNLVKADTAEKIIKITADKAIPFVDIPYNELPIPVGKVSADAGAIAYHSIKETFNLLEHGFLDGAAMAPISKEALQKARLGFFSEFDLFASLSKVDSVHAIVKCGPLFRSTVIGHVPFRNISSLLTTEKIVNTGNSLFSMMRRFGIQKPKLAVAALNPHAGEGGLLGDEEKMVIEPAISILKGRGIDAQGPFPADTLMVHARRNEFQGILFLYHDQGNIAFKAADFGENVLIYSDIPYTITSVGHGTAFDIAGKGVADPHNYIEAINVAIRLLTKDG
jgi:4-hydroxythreonine-4-phosphate dehydrogenase